MANKRMPMKSADGADVYERHGKIQMDHFEEMTSFSSLYDAHRKCRRGKLWKDSVATYDARSLECTHYLRDALRNGTYRMSGYHVFTAYERGKARQIKSTKYVDRVVLKSLCDNVLIPKLEPILLSANGASRSGKGTDYMRIRLRDDMREYFNKNGPDGYILVADFSKFFDSIPHDHLDRKYAKLIDDERVLALIKHIHSSTEGEVGLPLGNQTSQVDALFAINDIDHYIKERLHIRYYGRYMDDFYLIHQDKEYLQECLEQIRAQAAKIGMTLNDKKTYITTLRNGVNFIGFHFFMTRSGKVIIKARNDKAKKERQKLKKFREKLDAGEMTYENVQQSYQAWKAPLTARNKKGEKRKFRPNTYYMLLRMDKYYYDLFSDRLTLEERYKKTVVEEKLKKGTKKCRNY